MLNTAWKHKHNHRRALQQQKLMTLMTGHNGTIKHECSLPVQLDQLYTLRITFFPLSHLLF